MKILMLQTDIAWDCPEENRTRAAAMVRDAAPADLVVLPEMFTTGFKMRPEVCAEKEDGATLAWMRALAAERDAAVAGSVAVEEGGRYYNRFYFVRPDGSYASYDKRHLFRMAGEHDRYMAGTERVIVEWRGFRILLQTCYDLRFPVFARNRNDYDMIIYVANWPASRIYAWETLLRARAIENLCYVVGVNRVGVDPDTAYDGRSALVDPRGEAIAYAPLGQQAAISGVVDLSVLRRFRSEFPALDDADTFSLKGIV